MGAPKASIAVSGKNAYMTVAELSTVLESLPQNLLVGALYDDRNGVGTLVSVDVDDEPDPRHPTCCYLVID